MSDHEFEKQVRQKLADLKLTPTPQAWENIEEKLRERRRRAPFIWLPLLLAGMIAGGYLVLSTGNHKKPLALAQQDHQLQNVPAQKETATAKKPTGPSSPRQITSPENISANTTITHEETLRSVKHISATIGTEEKRTHAHRSHGIGKSRTTVWRPNHEHQLSTTANDQVADEPITTVDRQNTLPGDNNLQEVSTGNPGPADSTRIILKKSIPLLQPPVGEKAETAVSKPAAPKNRNSKWSYAVGLSTGVSAVNEGGVFGLNKPKVEDIAYTADFASTVVNYAPVYKPSSITPGFTFSAGTEVKRELSKRFSLSAGLNYTQLNTHTKVGDRINSSNVVNNGVRGYLYVQSYYLLDQNESKEYKNKYHFIELPLTLHTRLNKSESLPVFWNAGFVLSRLISSTSLHFDGSTGVYYKDDRLLNQTQAAIMTGFSFAFFNKTKYPLWVGPSVRSNINPILKKDVSDNKHFVMLGLDLKFYLKK